MDIDNKLETIDLQKRNIRHRLICLNNSLRRLRRLANILLGKVDFSMKETVREKGGTIVLEFKLEKPFPKKTSLGIQRDLQWEALSRVDFFNLIKSKKDEIKCLNRQYSELEKECEFIKNDKSWIKKELKKKKEQLEEQLKKINEELEELNQPLQQTC